MFRKIFDGVVRFLLGVGAVMLAFAMIITTLDVIMRYFFHRPIQGVYEIIELLMGVLSPIAILCCSWKKGHVRVDLVYNMLSARLKKATLMLSLLCTCAVFILLATQSVPLIAEVMESRLCTPTLGLPMWPAAAVICLSFMLVIPISVCELIAAFHSRQEDKS